MPIREKSTFKKFEFEYVSPDGDTSEITIVEHGERRYVQFSQSNGTVVVVDGEMLLDMADKYRDIMFARRGNTATREAPIGKPRRLAGPRITDHRDNSVSKMPAPVEQTEDQESPPPSRPVVVNDRLPDLSGLPSREFDGVNYDTFQTGDDRSSLDTVDETPNEWKIKDREDEELVGWQREAAFRSHIGRPSKVKVRGAKGEGFRRIGASELI